MEQFQAHLYSPFTIAAHPIYKMTRVLRPNSSMLAIVEDIDSLAKASAHK